MTCAGGARCHKGLERQAPLVGHSPPNLPVRLARVRDGRASFEDEFMPSHGLVGIRGRHQSECPLSGGHDAVVLGVGELKPPTKGKRRGCRPTHGFLVSRILSPSHRSFWFSRSVECWSRPTCSACC